MGGPESLSSHRLGLGQAVLYQGEWTRKDLAGNGEIEAKRRALWGIHPYLKALGVVSIVGIFAYVWRSRRPLHQLVWLGIYPLFIATTPQINYFNLRLLLVLFHIEAWPRREHRLGLALLFAVEVLTQGMYVLGANRYAVTSMASWGMLIYLAYMAVVLFRSEPRTHRLEPQPVSVPPVRNTAVPSRVARTSATS
jgi:hypothetical protein